MAQQMDRRQFLRSFGTSAAVLLGAACAPAAPATPTKPAEPAKPTAVPAATAAPAATSAPAATVAPAGKPAAQGDRLVVALGQWGTEAPFAWMSAAADKPLWDHMHDSLIHRDPATFAMRPGLATEWRPAPDYKSWTFKLRPGVMFHGEWGEFTAEDVKFTVEQNLKQGATGGSAPFFRDQLEQIETPERHTVVMTFKNPVWEVPIHFAQRTGYQNLTSKRYLETVGEDKARAHPIGTGPFKYVEGRQGDFHRFEAVQNHWRQTPGFKEMVIRKMGNLATVLAALRAGEVDVAQVTGDYLPQAKQAGLRIHEVPGSTQYWILLPGQTLPDKADYSPESPWVGQPDDPMSQENAKKVRLALNLAIDKQAIYDGLWQGYGKADPFSPWYYPHEKGFSQDWKIPPHDLPRAKQLLAEAGHPNGFEITVSGQTQVVDGPDVMEAVALDWEKLGLRVKRHQEDWTAFLPKVRARKTGVVAFPYGAPGPLDEASLSWQRTMWSKGTFNLAAESVEYDRGIEELLRETSADKRAGLQAALGQKLYDDMRVAMLGVKSTTFAVSKKVGEWPTLYSTLWENNFEYIAWTGQ